MKFRFVENTWYSPATFQILWHSAKLSRRIASTILKNFILLNFHLKFSGANINQQDQYGRAPLHVAAAVDYTEMIEFLLQHHADIDITTGGELQTPIHFAAKNDACQALKLLIDYGANVNCRDYQNRTPIQVRTLLIFYLINFCVSYTSSVPNLSIIIRINLSINPMF